MPQAPLGGKIGATFTRPSKAANFRPVTTMFEIQFERLYSEIAVAADAAVKKAMDMAFRTADAKVPVRKVFKGGRQTIRALSIGELQAESKMFRRALDLTPLNYHNLHKMYGVPHFRLGTKTVTHRNQANTWRNTERKRLLVSRMNPQTGAFELRFAKIVGGKMEPVGDEDQTFIENHVLNAEGRRSLTAARLRMSGNAYVDVGRGAVYVDQNPVSITDKAYASRPPVMFLGGNLKHSLIITDTTSGTVYGRSLRAGGARAPYAKFVEFGTRHAPAQPFLRPALKTAETRYRDIMRQKLSSVGKG